MFTDPIIVNSKMKKKAMRREHSDHTIALSKNPVLPLTSIRPPVLRPTAASAHRPVMCHLGVLAAKQQAIQSQCTKYPGFPGFSGLGKKLGDHCKNTVISL